MTEAKQLIDQELKLIDWKEPVGKLKRYGLPIIGYSFGALFLIIFFVTMDSTSKGGAITLVVFAILFFAWGIVTSIYYTWTYKNLVKENVAKLMPIWEKLHQLYFDHTKPFFGPNYALTFEGIVDSSAYQGNTAFKFSLNGEKVIFSVSEDVEKRTRTVKTSNGTTTETYYVYFLKYNLKSTAEKLINYDEIIMSNGSLKKPKQGYFLSESIDFNNHYRVMGHNSLQIYKLFTPKVIDNYLNLNGLNTVLRLENGYAYANFRDNHERSITNYPDICNLGTINWEQDKFLDSVYKKIELNFNRYISAQDDLLPLKLYDK